jgi:hypothetical protein
MTGQACSHRPPSLESIPGHRVLARMGKRVLRLFCGLELTQQLLTEFATASPDDVVECAPGLGVTVRRTGARNPHSSTAIERD